jgi:hypothetical protein
MNIKLLSGSDKHLLDTILTETKQHQEDYVGDYLTLKKGILLALETNAVTSCWKYIKQYQALRYLNLVK